MRYMSEKFVSQIHRRKVRFPYPATSSTTLGLYDTTLQVSPSLVLTVHASQPSLNSWGPNRRHGSQQGWWDLEDLNLVIGYVAQHAFHHIDHYLDKTSLEYMFRRYHTLIDRHWRPDVYHRWDFDKEWKTSGCIVTTLSSMVLRRSVYTFFIVWLVSYWFFTISRKSSSLILMRHSLLVSFIPLLNVKIRCTLLTLVLSLSLSRTTPWRVSLAVKIVSGAATWRRPHLICLDEPTS